MSYVTNLIVITLGNADQVNKLDQWLMEQQEVEETVLVKVDHHAGGYKVFEGDVWLGVCNYLDVQAFITLAQSLLREMRFPECFQVFIMDEDDDHFIDILARPSRYSESARY